MRACDLVVRAFGPWRSQSTSRRTRLAERLLPVRLLAQRRVLPLEELAVAAARLEEAAGVDGVEVEHAPRDVLEEPAVVADDQECRRLRLQQLLEPEDALEVEVVGRLVHAAAGRARAPAPRAIARRLRQPPDSVAGVAVGIGEAAAAERRADAGVSRGVRRGRRRSALGREIAPRVRSLGELRVLRHVGEARQPAQRDRPGVGRLEAGQHAQQRRLAAAVRTDEPDAVAVVDRRTTGRRTSGAAPYAFVIF